GDRVPGRVPRRAARDGALAQRPRAGLLLRGPPGRRAAPPGVPVPPAGPTRGAGVRPPGRRAGAVLRDRPAARPPAPAPPPRPPPRPAGAGAAPRRRPGSGDGKPRPPRVAHRHAAPGNPLPTRARLRVLIHRGRGRSATPTKLLVGEALLPRAFLVGLVCCWV